MRRCSFVQLNPRCQQEPHRLNYLQLFYCHSTPLMVLLGVAWLLLLFFIMTTVAEEFLCPSIEYLSYRMRMPQDIAGVTLFAFASGAPDLFTQVAALTAGDHVDIELAISSTFGGGLFIVAVVLSAVILSVDTDVLPVVNRVALVRDATAYLVACVLVSGLMYRGGFSASDGLLIFCTYFIYLGMCLAFRGKAAQTPLSPRYSRLTQEASSAHAGDAANASNGLELVTIVGSVNRVNSSPSPVPASPRSQSRSEKRRLNSVPSGVLDSARHQFDGCTAADVDGTVSLHSRLPLDGGVRIGGGDSPLGCTTSLNRTSSATHAGILPRLDDSLPSLGSPHIIQEYHSLERYLHLQGKHGVAWVLSVVTSPMVLLHAAIPSLHHGSTFGLAYAGVIATLSPPFFMFATFWAPITALGLKNFTGTWAVASFALFTLTVLVRPVTGSFPVSWTDLKARRPCQCMIFALVAFVQCMVVMNAAADEVVSLFETAGRIWSIPQSILGATFLAWGETVPDLVAVRSLARAGQGTMALAACFGGAVFNLLVSLGGPIVVAGARSGVIPYHTTWGVALLEGMTVVVLVVVLTMVPLQFDWQLPRKLAWGMLAGYAISQVIFFVSESL